MREIKITDGFKICTRCRKNKKISCFGKSKTLKCGLRGECLECRKEKYREKLEENRRYFRERHERVKHVKNKERRTAKHREKVREWYRKNSKEIRERHKKYVYPEKNERHKQIYKFQRSARKKLWRAIKRGQFERGKSCKECASTKNIEAHHNDYNFPYEVEWLCRSCHRKRHRKKQ